MDNLCDAFVDRPYVCCVRRRELGLPRCSSEWPSSPPPPPLESSPSGPAAGCCASTQAEDSQRATVCNEWMNAMPTGFECAARASYTLAWLRSSSFSSASFWLLSSIPSTTCFSFLTSSCSFWLLIWRSATQYTNSDVSLRVKTQFIQEENLYII